MNEGDRFSICKFAVNGEPCNEPFDSRKAVKRHLHQIHGVKMSRTYGKYESAARTFIPPKAKQSITTGMKGSLAAFRGMMTRLFHSGTEMPSEEAGISEKRGLP